MTTKEKSQEAKKRQNKIVSQIEKQKIRRIITWGINRSSQLYNKNYPDNKKCKNNNFLHKKGVKLANDYGLVLNCLSLNKINQYYRNNLSQ